MSGDDLQFPSDDQLQEAHDETGIPLDVLIRDTVRLVEVRHLLHQDFFAENSVLAGSMALRTFGSPRFTITDADFSTSTDKAPADESLAELFRYQHALLDIEPEGAFPNDASASLMKVQPIKFTAIFTSVVLSDKQERFHADVSFRRLVKPGIEVPLMYDHLPGLHLAEEPVVVWVMDPTETMAEKILGWCAHAAIKHYVDVAWIAMASKMSDFSLTIDYRDLRNTLGDKLDVMKSLQSDKYATLQTVDAVVGVLGRAPVIDQGQWGQLAFLKGRAPLQDEVIKTVGEVARALRRAQPR